MSRTIHWNDEHYPNGHAWIFCAASTLYPDFYYCPAEDLMWEPTVKPVSEKNVREQYNQERPDRMREYAQRNLALQQLRRLPFQTVIKVAKETAV